MLQNSMILTQNNARGATALQIGNIDILFTKGGLHLFLDEIVEHNIIQSVGEAKVIEDERKRIVNDKIIELLSNIYISGKEKLCEALKKPDTIRSIYKVQSSYIFEGDDKKIHLLLKMLENRIFAEDLDKILIDDCIDIVPELTLKHIELLKFKYQNKDNKFNTHFNNFEELENSFKNRYINISEELLSLSLVDLKYLIYKNILNEPGGVVFCDWSDNKNFSIENPNNKLELLKRYPHFDAYLNKEQELKFDSYTLTPLSNKLASLIIESEKIRDIRSGEIEKGNYDDGQRNYIDEHGELPED